MAVVTTGFFDGVHLGHRHVLQALVSAARERGEEAVVVTFWPHPRTVLQQDARDLRLLSTQEEKKQLLLAAGVDRVEVLPFTREFAALTASQYLSLLQERFGATVVVMGYDNRIGSDSKTASELCDPQAVASIAAHWSPNPSVASLPSSLPNIVVLRATQWAPPCHSPSPSFHQSGSSSVYPGSPSCHSERPSCHSERSEESLSSTRIRKALEEGDIAQANAMLGYRYGLQGVVVAGNRMGRTIGFPTANMQLFQPLKLVPGNGVYAVEVDVLGKQWQGMCNIGLRPTVGGTARTVETHILDFDQDIYGLPLGIRFVRRIRDERKFSSLDALRQQLLKDREQCLRTLPSQ